ncbi:hypothetical protein MJH12_20255 [bacterium]|nr:hypothetical protein [bacterium]
MSDTQAKINEQPSLPDFSLDPKMRSLVMQKYDYCRDIPDYAIIKEKLDALVDSYEIGNDDFFNTYLSCYTFSNASHSQHTGVGYYQLTPMPYLTRILSIAKHLRSNTLTIEMLKGLDNCKKLIYYNIKYWEWRVSGYFSIELTDLFPKEIMIYVVNEFNLAAKRLNQKTLSLNTIDDYCRELDFKEPTLVPRSIEIEPEDSYEVTGEDGISRLVQLESNGRHELLHNLSALIFFHLRDDMQSN